MKKNEIVNVASAEALERLRQAYPIDDNSYSKVSLPRLVFKSQNVLEGEGKEMKVIIEAGTFLTEKSTEELDENKKLIWEKIEIGKEIEATVLFFRRKLSYYDNNLETFVYSNVFDEAGESVSIFSGGVKIKEGLPADLKALYNYTDDNGKIRSKLAENLILYVLYSGEVFQLTIKGSSMWSWKTYAKQTSVIPAQLTKFNSEACEKGQIKWNKIIFEKVRDLSAEEVADVQGRVNEIKGAITAEKQFYAREKATDAMVVEYPKSEEGTLEEIPF